jgi:2-isopropylmalate synthase
MDRIKIFDTTLRDGEQSPGCSMNLQEKIEVARCLERMKVDVIEAGFARSSPGDFESVNTVAKIIKDCTVASLARANTGDIDAAWDAVKCAVDPRIHLFIATSPLHMEYKLKMNTGIPINLLKLLLMQEIYSFNPVTILQNCPLMEITIILR